MEAPKAGNIFWSVLTIAGAIILASFVVGWMSKPRAQAADDAQ